MGHCTHTESVAKGDLERFAMVSDTLGYHCSSIGFGELRLLLLSFQSHYLEGSLANKLLKVNDKL